MGKRSILVRDILDYGIDIGAKTLTVAIQRQGPKRSDWTQVSHRVAHPLLRYDLSTADSVSGKNSEKAVPLLPGRVVLDQPDAGNVFPSDHFAVMADVQLIPIA